GRQVESDAYLWITGDAGWWGGQGERLQIATDKKSYKPGDVAKVLVVTGAPNTQVLVTAEGRELYSRQVVKAPQPAVTVEIRIRAEYMPNFYVNATVVRDGQLYQGSKSLSVPATDQQLKVEVTPSKAEFKPGEPATYTITAHDAADKGVAA